ncbi:MAG TPA: glyoxalase [Gammaproteobacteria bacterium]|nr:glyoxalase [Gammaproteobacteria bacterium]|tara:strand:- start:1109 stop:2074 length:966 start_codon:yes stop_codon:yes gene_type:complete
MNETTPGSHVLRHHHITIATGGAQEDYDFHTKILGMKSVKKTLFYDGKVPIYHLYYGNDAGEESSLVTTFPMRHTGVRGRKGSGQVSYVALSIPTGAVEFWHKRLTDHGFRVEQTERFGETYLDFEHPCGVNYTLVAVAEDPRTPHTQGPVPVDMMIRGTHSIGVSLRDAEFMEEFMHVGWGGTRVSDDRNLIRYTVGKGGSGALVDFVVEPERKPGTWTVGEGAIHHMAFEVGSHEKQNELKLFLEAIGYTDVSDVKDRGYFDSIYIRTPSGAMFEATVSHNPGFTCDEPFQNLGMNVMVSPNIEQNKQELMSQIGFLKD